MSRQDLKLFLIGLLGTVLIGAGGWFLLDLILAPSRQDVAEPPPVIAAPSGEVKTKPKEEAPAAEEAKSDAALAKARAAVEEQIAGAPDIAKFFDQLRLALPGEYDKTIAALATRRMNGAGDTPDYDLSQAVKILRQTRGALAAKADGDALAKVFGGQLAVLKALGERDAHLCVDFLYGGASEGFLKFSAENRKLVADLAIAGLDAILNGKEKNVERKPPTEADFSLFETALRQKGLGSPEIGALLDGKTPEPALPDPQMCKAGQTYLETLSTLPAEVRERIEALAVDLMARS